MTWTAEAKLEATVRAPMSRVMLRPDTRVIERPGWYQIITPSAPGSALNEVVFSQVEADHADRVIDEVVAVYREVAHPTKWCVGPWTSPADFGERLTRRGFSSWDVRGMCSDTSRRIAAPDGVTVQEVDETTIREFVAAAIRGWSLPAEQTAIELEVHRAALAASPREAHFFAARAAGEMVGTTGLILRGDHAYLVGAQVFSSARGRGVYRALVGARLAFLARRGIELAVTHAREATSAPILDRLGFETVFRSKCFRLDLESAPTRG
jgi:hypothetical protein